VGRPEAPLVDELLRVLEETADEARAEPLPMGEVLDRLGDASFALICILVALPFLQPFNLGPFAAVGSLHFLALGWQLARGRPTPWVPARLREISFSAGTWRRLLGVCRVVITGCRRFTRQRYTEWTRGPRGHRTCGALLMVGGLLLALPFPGIPFTNTLPALMLVCVCIADLEQDGLLLLPALFFLAASLAYFAFVLYGLFIAGDAAMEWIGGVL
jgi:hypothetical protein